MVIVIFCQSTVMWTWHNTHYDTVTISNGYGVGYHHDLHMNSLVSDIILLRHKTSLRVQERRVRVIRSDAATSTEWMFADTATRVQVFCLSDSLFNQLTTLLLMPRMQDGLQACFWWGPNWMTTELFESWGYETRLFFIQASGSKKPSEHLVHTLFKNGHPVKLNKNLSAGWSS